VESVAKVKCAAVLGVESGRRELGDLCCSPQCRQCAKI